MIGARSKRSYTVGDTAIARKAEMPDVDFASTRLFLHAPLSPGARVDLSRDQFNYLVNVMRFADGDGLLVFDGNSGEWRARLRIASRKAGAVEVVERARHQPPARDLWYLFAPLKHARLDYLVQKATEMGATRLAPVITRRTQASRVNIERMRANVIEAAEQCGVLQVPEVVDEARFDAVLDAWPADRALIFCDENAPIADPTAVLRALPEGPLAVLIGPEGGFDPAERARIVAMPGAARIALGPRVLRADTAGVAALALVQAARGDWR